jgi:peptidoglycan/LPS O-acetylase OafA/YrhL
MSIDPGLRHWYTNILISVPCAAFVAVCSWWLVEKPVLAHRSKLKQLENWYLDWRPAVGKTLNSADRSP